MRSTGSTTFERMWYMEFGANIKYVLGLPWATKNKFGACIKKSKDYDYRQPADPLPSLGWTTVKDSMVFFFINLPFVHRLLILSELDFIKMMSLITYLKKQVCIPTHNLYKLFLYLIHYDALFWTQEENWVFLCIIIKLVFFFNTSCDRPSFAVAIVPTVYELVIVLDHFFKPSSRIFLTSPCPNSSS